MNQTHEWTDAGKIESRLDPLPVTPSGKSHIEIDQIVRNLATEHNLLLPERNKGWSPSKLRSSTPEKCYSCIKYLYFMGKPALHRAIAEFEESVHVTDSKELRLKKLLKCLDNEKWMLKNAIRPTPSFNKKIAETHQGPSSFRSAETRPDSNDVRNGRRGLMVPEIKSTPSRFTKGFPPVNRQY